MTCLWEFLITINICGSYECNPFSTKNNINPDKEKDGLCWLHQSVNVIQACQKLSHVSLYRQCRTLLTSLILAICRTYGTLYWYKLEDTLGTCQQPLSSNISLFQARFERKKYSQLKHAPKAQLLKIPIHTNMKSIFNMWRRDGRTFEGQTATWAWPLSPCCPSSLHADVLKFVLEI